MAFGIRDKIKFKGTRIDVSVTAETVFGHLQKRSLNSNKSKFFNGLGMSKTFKIAKARFITYSKAGFF